MALGFGMYYLDWSHGSPTWTKTKPGGENLPPSQTTNQVKSGAWSRFLGLGSKAPSQDPNAVIDSLQAHDQMHARLLQNAATKIRTGRTVQAASLAPDANYHVPSLPQGGMTAAGQSPFPIRTQADYTRPMPNAILSNAYEQDKGSITYAVPAGTGIHTAVPEAY